MSILIETVRVAGLRCLENIEVKLEKTTILTGMNNAGKTSFLKALQVALGSSQFISQDDFSIKGDKVTEDICIDIAIVPIKDGLRCEAFTDDWEAVFTTQRIRFDSEEKAFVPLRTLVTFDSIKNTHKTRQFILKSWPDFISGDRNWFDSDNGQKGNLNLDEIPFFYMDAQRDILEDIKQRNSYLGKMLSRIKYSEDEIRDIEDKIASLNETAVRNSDILSNIKTTLMGLDKAMDTQSGGVEITPFTKKIRDLNKGLTIHFTDNHESLPMEYHGMGTRSWSSLLTLKAYISLLAANNITEQLVFFPILAIEEPEAHLHPNAQKKLYGQMSEIVGQKIISTHSAYIPATAQLSQIRNFYKDRTVTCGRVGIEKLSNEEMRKISRQVINTRGEIFFSKVVVFVEGETEEQALPIFAQNYFGSTSVELGLDFVGVGGYGSYLPFMRFAEGLKIPWLIFSDAEDTPDKKVKKSVQKQFVKLGASKNESDCVVFLDDGNDFERQLIDEGFGDEIKKAVSSLEVYTNATHRAQKEPQRLVEIESLTDSGMYEEITKKKTQFGPAIAEQIVKSGKPLPGKVTELFSKVSSILRFPEAEA